MAELYWQESFDNAVYVALREGGMMLLEFPSELYEGLAQVCVEEMPQMIALRKPLLLDEDVELLQGFAALSRQSEPSQVGRAIARAAERLCERYQVDRMLAYDTAFALGIGVARSYGIRIRPQDVENAVVADAGAQAAAFIPAHPKHPTAPAQRVNPALFAVVGMLLAAVCALAIGFSSGLLPLASSGAQAKATAHAEEVEEEAQDPVAVAYGELLDEADSMDYSAGWDTPGPNADNADSFVYSLVEMSGDDIPELVIGAKSDASARYLVYYIDPVSGKKTQVLFRPLQKSDNPDDDEHVVFGRSPDGHGLVRFTQYFEDRERVYELITIQSGQATYETHDKLEYEPLEFQPTTDRAPLEEL